MRLITLLLFVLTSVAHAAGYYQWKDKFGNVVISDTPPPDAASRRTMTRIKAPVETVKGGGDKARGIRPGEVEMLEELDQWREEHNLRQEEEEKSRKDARAANEEKCKQYKTPYESISTQKKADQAAKNIDPRYRNKKYLRSKRHEYRTKMNKYCGTD